jgi:hypothetical protein
MKCLPLAQVEQASKQPFTTHTAKDVMTHSSISEKEMAEIHPAIPGRTAG